MKECPDLDALITIQEALDWDAESAMRHVVSCESCLAGLRQVERLHEVLDQSLDPTHGFADRVLASLPPMPSPTRSREQESRGWLLSAGIFALATTTALLLLSSAAIASPGAGGVRPEMLVFAGLVGFIALRVIPRAT